MSKHIFILTTVGITLAGSAMAQTRHGDSRTVEANKPVAALQQCRTLADTGARLACYDEAVDALTRSTRSGETVIVNREEVRAVRKGLFGFAMPKLPFLGTRANNAEDASDDAQLESTVVAFRSVPYQKWRIVIAGGAVWETTEADTRAEDPAKGAQVLIEKGSLGGYFLKVGRGRRVAAKRVG